MNTSHMSKKMQSEIITGILLIIATVIAIIIANTNLREMYQYILIDKKIINEFNLHMFINDFLMAIFFLMAGLEIKYEVLYGNLSSFKKGSFPVIAAIGGVILPAVIYSMFNIGSKFQNGLGIPISTDIAFAVGIFMIFQKKLNTSLKVFLLSLAVVDDLISIVVIGVVYSSQIYILALVGILFTIFLLIIINRFLKIEFLSVYLILGIVLWYFVYKSGIHSTISGVILAIFLPSWKIKNRKSILERAINIFSPICNYLILPIFAFSNTGINLNIRIDYKEVGTLAEGIILGLSIGKPIGIFIFTYIASKLGITEKPPNVSWFSILQVGMIAGIGFTMSIFVSELAFNYNKEFIEVAKLSILLAAICSVIFLSISIILLDIKHRRLKKSLLTK